MLGGQEQAYVREVSFVDPISRSLRMYSINLSLSRMHPFCFGLTVALELLAYLLYPCHLTLFCPSSEYLTVMESIAYNPSASAAHRETLFTQKAEITARGALWKSVKDKLENLSLETFQRNAAKGKEGFEQVLHRLFGEDSQRDVGARREVTVA